MNSYLSTKQKLRKVWEDTFGKQKDNIQIQKITNNKILVNFNNLKPNNSNFRKLVKFEFPYEGIVFPEDPIPSLPRFGFKEWEVEFSRFDIRLLPFIKAEVVYKAPEAIGTQLQLADGVTVASLHLSKNTIFQIEDLGGEDATDEFIKKVTMRSSIFLDHPTVGLPQLEVKLMVYFSNPYDFV